jgi:LmbE family N-acetylglucosaminyl deacetylase
MLPLHLEKAAAEGMSLLCLGAHCDDIEIGCGGTLLHLKAAFPRLKFHWVVFSASGLRGREAAQAADLFTAGCEKEILLKEFRDGFLPYRGGEVKELFEEVKSRVKPDLIFTHWQGDAHQDHRLISELTWNTFRNHLILEYEIPKYDGDFGNPNLYFELTRNLCLKKRDLIIKHFVSQQNKHWFTEDLLFSVLRLRGMESGRSSEYAEAFYCRKMVY